MKYLFSILIVIFSFGGFAQDSLKIKNDSLLTSLDSLDINPDSVKQKIIGLIIKSDFLSPAYAVVTNSFGCTFTLEKLIKKRHSIQITGLYFSGGISLMNLTDSYAANNNNYGTNSGRQNVYQIIPEYKFFITDTNMISGRPYVGAYLKWIKEEEKFDIWTYPNSMLPSPGKHTSADYNLSGYSLGLMTGYQFYLIDRFVIDFLIGFGGNKAYSVKKIRGDDINFPYNEWSLGVRSAINVGYKF